MNKNLLISAVLTALESKANLSFLGTKLIRKDGKSLRPQLQLIPVASGSYDFVQDAPGDNVLGKVPGVDPGLEYQLVVQLVDITTGNVTHSNANYFAKVLTNGKIKAYFCDTTSVCSEDRGTKEITLKDDSILVGGTEFFGPDLSGDIEFIAVMK
ncbi:MAG: hypothetical protein EOP07_25220 [Proteobacteria bacterium]|nr:MAG: hypothetical protein EOP07_25220 [Pseudomonadota bacterium]